MLGGTKIPLLGLILVAFGGTGVYASEIHFEAFPKELKANLSDSASMRCSLSNTGISFRMTSTAVDVRHISSIIITKNDGVEVASVTTFDPPMVFTDVGNLEVKGSLPATSGEGCKGSLPATSGEGFIELTWRDPSTMYLGNYKCEVNAVEARGHGVVLTSDLKLIAAEPSISEVIAEFNSRLLKLQQETDHKQQGTDKNQQDMTMDIVRLTTENQQHQHTIDNHQVLLNTQSNEIQNMTKKMTDLERCTSTSVAFNAALSYSRFSSHKLTVSSGETVMWDYVTLNQGEAYNATRGEFTCSVEGLYEFNVHAFGTSKKRVCLRLQKNGIILVDMFKDNDEPNHEDDASMSHVVQLQQGDVVTVVSKCTSVLYQEIGYIQQANYFNGHLVYNLGCSP